MANLLVSDLISRCLRTVGDATLTVQAQEWLQSVLYELESASGKNSWRFLETSSPVSTVNNTYIYAVPANFSKGLTVTSSEPWFVDQVSKTALERMRMAGQTGNPHFFARFGQSIYVDPQPVTGFLPTLTLWFTAAITIPSGSQDVLVTTGIYPKWHGYLIDGMIRYGMAYTDDKRFDTWHQKWMTDLALMVAENDEYYNFAEASVDPAVVHSHPDGTE